MLNIKTFYRLHDGKTMEPLHGLLYESHEMAAHYIIQGWLGDDMFEERWKHGVVILPVLLPANAEITSFGREA